MRCTLAVVLTLVEAYASAQSAKPPSVKTPPSPTTVAPPVEPSLAAGAGAGQPPPKAGWASRCASADRKSDLDCSVEQSVALKTGQIVVQFTVTVQAGGNRRLRSSSCRSAFSCRRARRPRLTIKNLSI